MANTTWSTTDKSGCTISGGNLVATLTSTFGGARAANSRFIGKYYWEVTGTTYGGTSTGIGIATSNPSFAAGGAGTANTSLLLQTGTLQVNGANVVTGFGTQANGTVVCFALDLDTRLFWVRSGAAGNWNNNVANNPATGVGGASLAAMGIAAFYPATFMASGSAVHTANFGDTAFSGTVPSGFTSGFPAPSDPLVAGDTSTFLEQWADTGPPAQTTQIFAEQWASAASTGLIAINTQIFLEQWAKVGLPRRAIRTQNVNRVVR